MLAVGILVDNGTVVIENIERWLQLGRPVKEAIIGGAREVGMPTLLATLAISIVFVPIFLLEGTAKYLFSPMSLSVIVALLASLALSFTLVPVMFNYLMRLALGTRIRITIRSINIGEPRIRFDWSIVGLTRVSGNSATPTEVRSPGAQSGRCRRLCSFCC